MSYSRSLRSTVHINCGYKFINWPDIYHFPLVNPTCLALPCLAIFHRGHRNISAIGVYSLKKLISQHATSQARVANSFGLVLFMLPLSSLPFSPFVSHSTCFRPLETGRLLSSTD